MPYFPPSFIFLTPNLCQYSPYPFILLSWTRSILKVSSSTGTYGSWAGAQAQTFALCFIKLIQRHTYMYIRTECRISILVPSLMHPRRGFNEPTSTASQGTDSMGTLTPQGDFQSLNFVCREANIRDRRGCISYKQISEEKSAWSIDLPKHIQSPIKDQWATEICVITLNWSVLFTLTKL